MVIAMMRFMALGLILFLAGCNTLDKIGLGGGGNGGGGGGGMQDPRQDFDVIRERMVREAARAIFDAANDAREALPAFGSVTQSSNVDSVTGRTRDRVTVRFDGSEVLAEIGAHRLAALGSDEVIPSPVRTGYEHQQVVAVSLQGDVARFAVIGVDWDPDDPTDYIGFGYWLGVDGLFDADPQAEVGAFIDGPELRTAPVVPIMGSATYSGRAQGFYGALLGAERSVPAGTIALGEFTADATLNADFDQATIGGMIDNVRTVETGVNPLTGATLYSNRREATAYELVLQPTPIGNGMFTGGTELTNPDLTITASSGKWGGRFSSSSASDGNPRSVVGTFGAQAETAGGTRAQLIGVFEADK